MLYDVFSSSSIRCFMAYLSDFNFFDVIGLYLYIYNIDVSIAFKFLCNNIFYAIMTYRTAGHSI